MRYSATVNIIRIYFDLSGLLEARVNIAATTISVNNTEYAVFVGGRASGTTYSTYIDIL